MHPTIKQKIQAKGDRYAENHYRDTAHQHMASVCFSDGAEWDRFEVVLPMIEERIAGLDPNSYYTYSISAELTRLKQALIGEGE